MRGAGYQQQTILSLYKEKMMKHRIINHIALFALLLLTACQSDDTTGQGGGIQPDGKVRVRLNVGVEGSQRTRAWQDVANAVTAEMMNVWTVVVVNDNDGADKNKVVSIYACKPSGEPDQEIDNYVELPATGSYRFYSFANMSPKVVMSLLGIGGSGAATAKSARTRGDNDDPTGGNEPNGGGNESGSSASAGTRYQSSSGDAVEGTVNSNLPAGTTDDFYTNDNTYQQNKFYSIAFTESVVTAASVESKTVNVAGNNFDVIADDNGFGAKGIPMSNVQTITVSETTDKIELIVIRMMAKIEVDVYNDGETDATIQSVSLTEITKNANGNLKLLPNLSNAGHGSMEVVTHGDIQPNLPTNAPKGNMTLYPSSVQGAVSKTGHKSTGEGQTPVKFIFYVNESSAPGNGSGLFYLSLGIKTGTGDEVVYSHALISDEGSSDDDHGKWNYIARNDYRIIPVVLTDWQFRIEPIALAPIAGYPAMTLSSDGLKATFSTGGFIALQPYVKKRTDTEWRDFSNPEVQVQPVSWKTKGDDTPNPSGDGKMIKTPFAYDSSTHYIIGELNNNLSSGTYTTAVTVTVKLGPSGSQFTYSFTCDVILQVP
jgi:hypothetical protein